MNGYQERYTVVGVITSLHFNTASGNTMYFSGSDDKSEKGVAILLPKAMNRFVVGYNHVSERIITLRLNAKPTIRNICNIGVCAHRKSKLAGP